MIPSRAAAKADAGSRESDRAGTCAKDIDIYRWFKRCCGQDRLQGKELCKSSVVREE